ncbi:MAG: LPS export ABC transporter periplasmic protein LptC [Bacteroidales bacterium]|nr:LPS export ABC transporter periplasmic protein LptC [Bacteroidales bacterium]
MRHILSIISLTVLTCLYASCSGTKNIGQAEAVEGDEIPAMVTRDVVMLISDSGVIKYRAITPNWTRFGDEAKEPYQYFPEGVRFEQVMRAEGDSVVFVSDETIVADTAYNWEDRQLWRLVGNVEVRSLQGELFQTEELFWNMKDHQVYSDSFIHIERKDNIIEGYGFTSNDDFSEYNIRQTSGVFPARENNQE